MGTVRVRPLECGWLTSDAGTMATGALGRTRMPVGAFVVEHPSGTLVFDTGMHPEVEQTKDRLRSTAPLFDVELDAHWSLTGQLDARELGTDDIDLVVLSHLHFDHAGGVGQLPNARMLVQRSEWEAAFDDRLVDFGVYNPGDFDVGHDRLLLDGDHDVFGDGSVLVVPTPGHTVGHQSLLIEGRLLLVGDACYTQRALDVDVLPPFGHDRDRQRLTYGWLRDQQADGVSLVYSHDAEQWVALDPEL